MSKFPTTAKIDPNDHHQALMAAFKDAIKTHGMALEPLEWLALASQFVGLLTAAQDSRKYTPDEIMEIVGANIEQGNRDFINAMAREHGGLN
jgi:hypothetical protein